MRNSSTQKTSSLLPFIGALPASNVDERQMRLSWVELRLLYVYLKEIVGAVMIIDRQPPLGPTQYIEAINVAAEAAKPLLDRIEAVLASETGCDVDDVLAFIELHVQGCTKAAAVARSVGWPVATPLPPGDVLAWLLYEATTYEEDAVRLSKTDYALQAENMRYATTLRAYSSYLISLGVPISTLHIQLLNARR